MRRTLVLGLGNDLLGDDGVGLRVVEELKRRPSLAGFEFETAATAGLALLDILHGHERAYIVDSVVTGRRRPGYLHRLSASSLAELPLNPSSHYAGLPEVLALGQALNLGLPLTVEVLGVEVEDPYTIQPGLSPRLEAKLPALVDRVEKILLEGRDA
jgi:hydrogenase maturation protease